MDFFPFIIWLHNSLSKRRREQKKQQTHPYTRILVAHTIIYREPLKKRLEINIEENAPYHVLISQPIVTDLVYLCFEPVCIYILAFIVYIHVGARCLYDVLDEWSKREHRRYSVCVCTQRNTWENIDNAGSQ